MNESALSAPRKVEYVILAPRRRQLWKVSASLALVIGVLIGFYLLMRHEPSEAHVYSPEAIPAIGLNASLSTKSVNGAVQYKFRVKPTVGAESRFVSVLQSVPLDTLHFGIHLLDKDGFEICGSSPKVHKTVGADGKPVALTADQVLANCTEEQMRAATKWGVSYTYPLLSAVLTPATKPPIVDGRAHSRPTSTSATRSVDPAIVPKPSTADGPAKSRLTGTDAFSGRIETLDQGSFSVTKQAEQMTLAGWFAPDEVELSCKQTSCLVTDLRTHQSVHAEKRKD